MFGVVKETTPVGVLCNEMLMEARNSTMKKCLNRETNILICSNSCSRASKLDVNLVVNYDTPVTQQKVFVVNYDTPVTQQKVFDAKVYTYRVGRIAHFGKSGTTVKLNDDCLSDVPHILSCDFGIRMLNIC